MKKTDESASRKEWQTVDGLRNQQNCLLWGKPRMGMGRMFDIMPAREKNKALDAILGCRIRTHYNTGGVAKSYSGPYLNGCYSLVYLDDNGMRSWLNTITVENGRVLCEGKPLQVGRLVRDVQMSLF